MNLPTKLPGSSLQEADCGKQPLVPRRLQKVAEFTSLGPVLGFTDVSIQPHSLSASKLSNSWALLTNWPSGECLLERKSGSGSSCAKSPGLGPPGSCVQPSVSPLRANLSGSQRSRPLTQTAEE